MRRATASPTLTEVEPIEELLDFLLTSAHKSPEKSKGKQKNVRTPAYLFLFLLFRNPTTPVLITNVCNAVKALRHSYAAAVRVGYLHDSLDRSAINGLDTDKLYSTNLSLPLYFLTVLFSLFPAHSFCCYSDLLFSCYTSPVLLLLIQVLLSCCLLPSPSLSFPLLLLCPTFISLDEATSN